MTIDMTGRAEANGWLMAAEQLNLRTEQLLDEVSRTLTDIKQESEGSIVDELFSLGNSVTTHTRSLMSAMAKITSTINGILGAVSSVLSGGVEAVGAVISKL